MRCSAALRGLSGDRLALAGAPAIGEALGFPGVSAAMVRPAPPRAGWSAPPGTTGERRARGDPRPSGGSCPQARARLRPLPYLRPRRRGVCEPGSAFFPTLAPANRRPRSSPPAVSHASAPCAASAGDKGLRGRPARAPLRHRGGHGRVSPRPPLQPGPSSAPGGAAGGERGPGPPGLGGVSGVALPPRGPGAGAGRSWGWRRGKPGRNIPSGAGSGGAEGWASLGLERPRFLRPPSLWSRLGSAPSPSLTRHRLRPRGSHPQVCGRGHGGLEKALGTTEPGRQAGGRRQRTVKGRTGHPAGQGR